jgi:Na+/H+-dicarboxylate symporter
MLKQIALTAFITALAPATMQQTYTVSAKDMHIDASFTNLWLSLGYNLLSPARTISLVLAVFFVADVSGMSVDTAVLIIMLITVIQMSLASTGTTAGATATLETLKMSTDMVGLFSAFEMFTRNAGAAYDVTYIMLEQLDAARETGNINADEEKTSEG